MQLFWFGEALWFVGVEEDLHRIGGLTGFGVNPLVETVEESPIFMEWRRWLRPTPAELPPRFGRGARGWCQSERTASERVRRVSGDATTWQRVMRPPVT